MSDTLGESDTLASTSARPPDATTTPPERYGHYAIGPVLGRGGMGEVISATDERIGRVVAIKRMRGSDPESIARFIREAKIQARLEHPAIVPVHEIAQDVEGKPIIVMKQLRGTTLAELLRKLAAGDPVLSARLTRQRLLRAFADVCMAIELAHSRGVVHRDLKPSNITLGEFGEVYVLDWGIAKLYDESDVPESGAASAMMGHTVAGTILGTPGYMAPEQARGGAVDARTDVYGLGCVLFEILTGEPLGASRFTAEDRRPSTCAPHGNIAPELDDACMRATSMEPEKRFASARELGEAIEAYLDGDRDVVQRQKVAAAALHEARAALARGTGDSDRREAMIAASRALALDPGSGEAAALVARLMLEPPRAVPPEVEREVSRQEIVSLDEGSQVAMRTWIANLAFVPLMLWAGIAPAMVLVMAVVSITAATSRKYLVRGDELRREMVIIFLVCSVGIHAVLSFLASPLIAATTALVSLARTSMRRGLIDPWVLAAFTTVAVLLPILLGGLGVTSPSVEIDGSGLRVHMMAEHLNPTPTALWLLLLVPAMFASIVGMNRPALDRERAERRANLLQAWWLRQLVPTSTASR